ncbi:MAG: hypothetical protein ACP6IP_05475 [Candidatus Njordarchaeia archaeon]
MEITFYLISLILGYTALILSAISFIIMITSWKKEVRSIWRITHPILTSLFLALALVLLLYGYKVI